MAMSTSITRVINPLTLRFNAVDAAAEAQQLVRAAAEPREPGESVKASINRAARRLGLKPRRVEQAWYRQPARWLSTEMDTMRARAADALRARQARLRSELAALDERLALLPGDRP